MRSKVNISNSRRQVVNKQISQKVSQTDKFSKELFNLSKGNGKEIINHALSIITTKGRLKESQEDMRLYLGKSKKSIIRALNKLKEKAIRPRYNRGLISNFSTRKTMELTI